MSFKISFINSEIEINIFENMSYKTHWSLKYGFQMYKKSFAS